MSGEKSSEELIREIYEAVIQMRTALFGMPDSNDKGLFGEFNGLKKDYYSFKRWALIVFGILVGSGALSGAIYGLTQVVK